MLKTTNGEHRRKRVHFKITAESGRIPHVFQSKVVSSVCHIEPKVHLKVESVQIQSRHEVTNVSPQGVSMLNWAAQHETERTE